jgi:thiol-disulfide isomerase/thioredoxin
MKQPVYLLLLLIISLPGLAQSGMPDSLFPQKKALLSKYIPTNEGEFLYKAFMMEPNMMLEQLGNFHTAADQLIQKYPDTARQQLMKKDVAFFIRNLLSEYTIYYGVDSVKQARFYEFMEQRVKSPGTGGQIDSVYKTMHVKKMDSSWKKQLDSMVYNNWAINDWDLYQQSAAYRRAVNEQIDYYKYTTHRQDFANGVNNDIIRQTIIREKVTAPRLKEYLDYEQTGDIIKSGEDSALIATAYQQFISTCTNKNYTAAIQQLYNNYRQFSDNSPAPDFSYRNISNNLVSLRSLSGKFVYIDIWATWCGPCKAEIPYLTTMEEQYKGKNIHFVSISVDQPADKEKWKKYVTTKKLKGIQLMTDHAFDAEFIKKFNINSIPRFILIDPMGKIVSANAMRPSDPELKKQLDKLLGI